MKPHDLYVLSATLPLLNVSEATTEEQAMSAVHRIAQLEGCTVGVTHFSGLTPWERHPQDELLFVLEGAVEVTVLDKDEMLNSTVNAGSVFVIPKGLWHRQLPQPTVKLMFITGETEISHEEIPS